MLQPGRKYSAGDGYRYGFNGKENDNEVKDEGNQQDYGMRIYDPRLGRFLSVDPAYKEYVSYSPYNFCANNPLINVDIDGERIYFIPGLAYDKRDPGKYVKGIEANLELNNIQYLTVSGSMPKSYDKWGGKNIFAKIHNTKGEIDLRGPDLGFVIKYGWKPAIDVDSDERIANVAHTIAQDLIKNPKVGDEQINLMGTSQGAVSVAQAAVFLAENPERFGLDKNFKIDNLVLVGSPVATESALYKKLQDLVSQGKIGTILYKDYQSKDENDKYNDQVTGIARKSKLGTVLRGIGVIFDVFFKRKDDHPQMRAAADKPTKAGYNTFGEQIVDQLKKDNVH